MPVRPRTLMSEGRAQRVDQEARFFIVNRRLPAPRAEVKRTLSKEGVWIGLASVIPESIAYDLLAMRRAGRPPHPDVPTPREWEVLELIRKGMSNPEIAARLEITRAGARYHVSEILSKLGLRTRQEAARWRREDHRPWWTAGLAPFAFLGRRSGPVLAALKGGALVVSGGVVIASVGGLALVAALLLRGGDEPASLLSVGSTATASAPPAPTVDPQPPPWLPGVGAIIEAVESGDVERARSFVRSTPVPAVSGCEDGVLIRLDIDTLLPWWSGKPTLYGVYRAPAGLDLRLDTPPQYIVVFLLEGPQAGGPFGVVIDQGRIVELFFGGPARGGPGGVLQCARDPAQLVDILGLADGVLPPVVRDQPSAPTVSGLKQADADTPTAGICPGPQNGIATITLKSDLPSPRCTMVTGRAQLKFVNAIDETVGLRLGRFAITLMPGREILLDEPIDTYLAPGDHVVSTSGGPGGGEVFVVED